MTTEHFTSVNKGYVITRVGRTRASESVSESEGVSEVRTLLVSESVSEVLTLSVSESVSEFEVLTF